MGIFVWYIDKYPEVLNLHGDKLEMFFDRGEPFKGSFEKRWRAESQKYKQTKVWNSWQLISRISSVDMKAVPGLQAADILAWAVNRDASISKGKGKFFRHIMHHVIPASFAVWDEALLRRKHRPLLHLYTR